MQRHLSKKTVRNLISTLRNLSKKQSKLRKAQRDLLRTKCIKIERFGFYAIR